MNKIITLLCSLAVVGTIYATSPYINKVYEFKPAPGQFINELPEWEEGDDAEDMRLKAQDCIADHQQIMVSLGGFGGYVTFGFDHMVPNVPGEYDLKILGNAFYADANPKDTTALGGSSEPGIVMVSYDANNNGKPDDEWYELAGSEYYAPTTRHNYTLTYHRPSANHIATPNNDYKFLNDTTYIAWESSDGEHGYLSRNTFHNQNYYPNWIDEDSISFTGTILRNNAIDESGVGNYYVLYCFDWGYVDNHPNTSEKSCFKIDWAVNSEGTPVTLPGIHFVKVYTGVNQYAGWLGETSTEVLDAWDIHMLSGLNIPSKDPKFSLLTNPVQHQLIITSGNEQQITIYNSLGCEIASVSIASGTSHIDCSNYPKGLYIIKHNSGTLKFIKK